MPRLTLAAIACVIAMTAFEARAKQPLLVQAAPPALPATTIDQGKVLAIGTGVLLGAAVGSLVTLRGATLIGAMAGGVLGAWWYGEHSDIAALEPRKR
jgi:outer membrane lipoprotein SlyB